MLFLPQTARTTRGDAAPTPSWRVSVCVPLASRPFMVARVVGGQPPPGDPGSPGGGRLSFHQAATLADSHPGGVPWRARKFTMGTGPEGPARSGWDRTLRCGRARRARTYPSSGSLGWYFYKRVSYGSGNRNLLRAAIVFYGVKFSVTTALSCLLSFLLDPFLPPPDHGAFLE